MGWRILIFAFAFSASPLAMAATELRSGAGYSGVFGLAADPGLGRGGAETLVLQTAPLTGDLAATDDRAFAVDAALLEAGKTAAPAKQDRFSWVFLLIAFAGLTAVFAGRRTGGRGLISA
jgi:hypothetical protein